MKTLYLSKRLLLLATFVVLVATLARAQVAASDSDPAVIAKKLASADPGIQQDGIDDLHDLGAADQHALGASISKWGEPLLATKHFDDAQKLAELIVLRRAHEPAVFEPGLKYLVTVYIRKASSQSPDLAKATWKEALPLAKEYYNAAVMLNSAVAANMLAEILAQVRDGATATEFLKQQASADDSTPTSRPSSILNSIHCDQTHYDFAIQYLQHGGAPSAASYSPLIAQGNYYLMNDKPALARKCFEGACRVAGTKGKQVREAVEGVARAMRAQDGQFAHANAFIESLRDDPESFGKSLMAATADSPKAEDIRTAAGAIKLADPAKLDTTPTAPK